MDSLSDISPTTIPQATWDSVESPPLKRKRSSDSNYDSPALSVALDILFNEESAPSSLPSPGLEEYTVSALEKETAHVAFESSICRGDEKEVLQALNASSYALEALRADHLRYLHLAISSSKPQIADILVVRLSDPSQLNAASTSAMSSGKGKVNSPYTPESLFEELVEKDAPATARFLVQCGLSAQKLSPLALAYLGLVKKDPSTIRTAVRKGLPTNDDHPLHALARAITCEDVNRPSQYQYLPLHIAARHGHIATARYLLDLGANIETRDSKELTPFLVACSHGHKEMALILLSKGANIYETNSLKQNALHLLCSAKYEAFELLRSILARYEGDIDLQDHYTLTPLHYACMHGRKMMATALLDRKASVNLTDKRGLNALLFACASGNVSLVTALLDRYGSTLDIKDNTGNSPLHIACEVGHLELFRELYRRGTLLNATDETKHLLLVAACRSDNPDLLGELIEIHHFPVRWKEGLAFPPLLVACTHSSVKIAKILIAHGAAVNCTHKNGSTLLDRAGDNKEMIMTLITAGVLPPLDPRARERCAALLEEILTTNSAAFYAILAALPEMTREKWLELLRNSCPASIFSLPSPPM